MQCVSLSKYIHTWSHELTWELQWSQNPYSLQSLVRSQTEDQYWHCSLLDYSNDSYWNDERHFSACSWNQRPNLNRLLGTAWILHKRYHGVQDDLQDTIYSQRQTLSIQNSPCCSTPIQRNLPPPRGGQDYSKRKNTSWQTSRLVQQWPEWDFDSREWKDNTKLLRVDWNATKSVGASQRHYNNKIKC